MLDLARRHAPLLCALVLLWSAHDMGIGEPLVSAEVRPALAAFSEERLALRDPLAAAQPLGDPFRNELDFEPPPAAPPPAPEEPEPEPEEPAPPSYLDLRLESVVAFGGGRGSARVSGQTLGVGQRLRGWEPADQAPLLVSVEGFRARLLFAGELHELDINGRSSVRLTRPPGSAPDDGRPSVAPEPAEDAP